MVIHFGFLLPVTGSSIAYGRNVYSVPGPHKAQGNAKSRKSLSGGKNKRKRKESGERGHLNVLKHTRVFNSFRIYI